MRPINTIIVTKDSDGFIKTWTFNRLCSGWSIKEFCQFLLKPAYNEKFEILSIQKAPLGEEVKTQFDSFSPICL